MVEFETFVEIVGPSFFNIKSPFSFFFSIVPNTFNAFFPLCFLRRD